jgi:hypothetical protein
MDETMHLTSETDRNNIIGADTRFFYNFANAFGCTIPPQIRMLFAPKRTWSLVRIFVRCNSQHLALIVHEQGFGRSCRNVESKKEGHICNFRLSNTKE